METIIGNLKTSRVCLGHFDVSTQADIQVSLRYGSEEDMMEGVYNRNEHDTPLYSKQDIKEQYCISSRGLGALENDKLTLFGCLSSRHNSPCSNRTSLLTACVRQKVPSDENLYELYKRHPSDFAPYPRRSRNPWGPLSPEIYRYDEELKTSYFRRKVQIDPSRYTWMPTDDESVRMEKPRSVADYSLYNQHSSECQSMVIPSKKHVSFARSQTLANFDNAISELSASSTLHKTTRSQERLLDVRKTDSSPITKQPESDNVVLDTIKRAPMKTQATQTEIGLGRKLNPPTHIILSPRTVYKVKMVSQEAQTNGFIVNGRKLIKSFSEIGSKFNISYRSKEELEFNSVLNHQPLQRTQSDEPPRSPFIVETPLPFPATDAFQQLFGSDLSSLSKSDSESEDSTDLKNEIFIDFKPQISHVQKTVKKLSKTLSDGEILVNRKRNQVPEIPQKTSSVSHENILELHENFTPHFQNVPIQNEGIYKTFDESLYLSINGGSVSVQDSMDEEFHENLFYNKIYMNGLKPTNTDLELDNHLSNEQNIVSLMCELPEDKTSPFASTDSLNNGVRDHSDGIWNESQSTVLQIDSGTDSGTILSISEFPSTVSPCSTNLLTPSRRKQLLLLQHQQRSSIDTDALDEEIVDMNDMYSTPSVDISMSKELTVSPSSRHYMSTKPYVHQKIQECPSESLHPAIVPDLLLTRTDSCKTNTDLSESTTTDDYITANSGTDSSRRSGSLKGTDHLQPCSNKGANFGNTQIIGDDMVVPSLSVEEILASPKLRNCCNTPMTNIFTGRSTPSEYSSSSCGSYSVGSIPDLLEKSNLPLEVSEKKISNSKEILFETSTIRKSDTTSDTGFRACLEYASNRKHYCKGNTENIYSDTYTISSFEKYKISTERNSSPLEGNKNSEKSKRLKPRLQSYKRGAASRKSPYKDATGSSEKAEKVTSDESSSDLKQTVSANSSRKTKRNKEALKRKSLPKSTLGQKVAKKNCCKEKSSSLPGSLSRKKSSKQTVKNGTGTRLLSPISFLSDTKGLRKSHSTSKLNAVSVESLRSVSPGSDSVFYSDPNNHMAENQIHCLHCGRDVDIITTVDFEKKTSSCSSQQGIVQPPMGFGDSPTARRTRLYRKFSRRIKSEERHQMELVTDIQKTAQKGARAKSEERGVKMCRSKLRPMAKSRSNSLGQLKAADSSPSILPGAPEDDDDNGVYDLPYYDGYWIRIEEEDEMNLANAGHILPSGDLKRKESVSSVSSTESEQEFRKRYQAVIHRMVHRKSCLEMYERQNSKSFDPTLNSNDDKLRQKLEDMFKIMLVIWCQERRALNITAPLRQESDKTIIVQRDSGEFGFRIHGSKPVVVSAIEPGTPAETSGLVVGDIVLSVNDVSVLDKSHSEVVKIAHAGSDILKLEVARTCYMLNTPKENPSVALHSGYLWKLKGYASGTTFNKWIRRWFCLKENNCLYYYKTDSDKEPVGVLTLFDHTLKKLDADKEGVASKLYKFVIQRSDEVPLYLAADTSNAQERWMEVISKAINDGQVIDNFLERTKTNLVIPPAAICQPDCFGYLIKLGNQWKAWSRTYCVLKDACLYFYHDINASSAYGAAYLHGYRVQQFLSGNKKHAFEVVPPDSGKKYYYFQTESEADRKRWIAALEYSIDKWLKVGETSG